MNLRDQSLGQLALSIPGASALFRQYDLDFCCGGKKSLTEAVTKAGFDINIVERQLMSLVEKPLEKDWRVAPLGEIIDFIVTRYHNKHRAQLPELILQAKKIEHVHREKPNVPNGLSSRLIVLFEELSSHMMKEENVLFPMIKSGLGSQAEAPINVMEQEHDDAGQIVAEIKVITKNVTPPPEACTTWRVLYQGINEFIDDLMNHISLENNLLFPRALAGE